MTASFRRNFLLTMLATLILSACGFHLRGGVDMPFATAYISGSEHHPLITNLRRQLRLNNVDVLEAPNKAQVVIRILELSQERDILSLNAAGKAREYRLFYNLGYAVDNAQGQTLRLPDRISLRRDYTYDSALVLAKAQEEALLYRDMEDDMARQLMRRLATVKLTAAPQ